jgi:hypothetical protein
MANPSTMLQINIPKPCHEDWNAMTPTSRGAFCSACAKDVVDFTTMTDDEVQHYLLNKAGEKVCGKFYNTQLHRIRINIPNYIFYAKIAGWKKFMAIVMLAFGSMLFGCDVTTDKPVTDVVKTEKPNSSEQVLGESSYFVDLKEKVATQQVCEIIEVEPEMIKSPIFTTMGFIVPVIMGDMEVKPALNDTTEVYEMVGGIRFVDTTIQKVKKDSLTKSKPATDTANCKGEHFY